MKREEKNAQSRQRILDAAMQEFAARGYEGASLNTVCAEHQISKGIIYHHFKDKDEIYLRCVADCFQRLTAYLEEACRGVSGCVEERMSAYFNARLRFFAENPRCLGIFTNVTVNPPPHLSAGIAQARTQFDALTVSVLTALLESAVLRPGVTVPEVVGDFRMYMDYFNMRFRDDLADEASPEETLRKHEERSHRQLDLLLYGALVRNNEEEK